MIISYVTLLWRHLLAYLYKFSIFEEFGVDSSQNIDVLTEAAGQFPREQFQVSVVLNLLTIIVAHGITDSLTPNEVW